MRLNLLSKKDGKPAKEQTFEYANTHYFNILLLFINYADLPNPKKLIREETAGLVRSLFSLISPFNKSEVKNRVNVFTPKPSDHLELSGPDFVPAAATAEYEDEQWDQIEDYIKGLEYPGFIELGDEVNKGDAEKIWLEPKLDDGSVNRRYGCIVIILGGDLVNFGTFYEAEGISFDNDHSYIMCFSKTLSSGRHNPIWLTNVMAHEIGHSIGLVDEYEETPYSEEFYDYIPDPSDPTVTIGEFVAVNDPLAGIETDVVQGPNAVSKKAILYSHVELKPGIVPVSYDINFESIPWSVWCEKRAPVPNPSRECPESKCVDDANNNYFYNAPPYEPDMAFCRLPIDHISPIDYWPQPPILNLVGMLSDHIFPAPVSVGLYEGAYYKSFDVYRPFSFCGMRHKEVNTNSTDFFCPVCEAWIEYRISLNTISSDSSDFTGFKDFLRLKRID